MADPIHLEIEELRGHAERLVALLSDPHPGLLTWHGFVDERFRAIARFLPEDILVSELLRRASSPPSDPSSVC